MDRLLPGLRGHQLALGVIGAGLLASALVVFLLWIPVISLLFWMLGGPFWINLPIHGTLIVLAMLAWEREIPRAWGVVPLIVYAGGALIFLGSLSVALERALTVRADNARAVLPAVHPVTLYGEGENLLAHFDVARLLQASGDGEQTARWVVEGPACENGPRFFYDKRFSPSVQPRPVIGESAEGAPRCIASQHIRNRNLRAWPGYRIEKRRIEAPKSPFLSREETAFDLHAMGDGDAAPVTLIDGGVRLGAPVPVFYFGCAPISLNWECGSGLWPVLRIPYYFDSGRSGSYILNDIDRELARAIGLKPRVTAPATLSAP